MFRAVSRASPSRNPTSSECGGSHATLRRSKTRSESWRGHLNQGEERQRVTSESGSTAGSEYMVSKTRGRGFESHQPRLSGGCSSAWIEHEISGRNFVGPLSLRHALS